MTPVRGRLPPPGRGHLIPRPFPYFFLFFIFYLFGLSTSLGCRLGWKKGFDGAFPPGRLSCYLARLPTITRLGGTTTAATPTSTMSTNSIERWPRQIGFPFRPKCHRWERGMGRHITHEGTTGTLKPSPRTESKIKTEADKYVSKRGDIRYPPRLCHRTQSGFWRAEKPLQVLEPIQNRPRSIDTLYVLWALHEVATSFAFCFISFRFLSATDMAFLFFSYRK